MRGSLPASVGILLASAALSLAAAGSTAGPAARWVAHDLGVPITYDSGDGSLIVGSGNVAINERGQVIGTKTDGARSRAFLWEHGRLKDLGALPGYTDSSAVAINDRGQVVGVSWNGPSSSQQKGHAFLWENGRMRDLGVLPGGEASSPVDINELGQVAGNATHGPWGDSEDRAVLWKQGHLWNLGTLPGSSDSYNAAMNDHGQIVGWSATDTKCVAFLWQNGKMRSLGTLPGRTDSFAIDINDHGQAVGVMRGPTGYEGAFLWQKGKMSAITSGSNLGWEPEWEPVAINDRGQVALNYANEWIFWRGGKIRHRGTGEARALNERGQVAIADYSDTVPRIWRDGKTTRLPLLPGDQGGAAIALNEQNQVVGISGTLHMDDSGEMLDYWWDCHFVLWTWER